jgi:hypothetical protein
MYNFLKQYPSSVIETKNWNFLPLSLALYIYFYLLLCFSIIKKRTFLDSKLFVESMNAYVSVPGKSSYNIINCQWKNHMKSCSSSCDTHSQSEKNSQRGILLSPILSLKTVTLLLVYIYNKLVFILPFYMILYK